MKVRRLSHITIMVKDLNRTARFLCEGLGAREVYDSHARNYSIAREKFFLLAGVWLAAMEGPSTEPSYAHVAFEVDPADLPAFEARLRALEAPIKSSRPRVDGEGDSLYFYDYDNNLFELHAGSLEKRLALYKTEALDETNPPTSFAQTRSPG